MTIATAAVVVLILAAAILIPRLGGSATAQAAEIDYSGQPFVGSADAPVRMLVFFDFLCPHCASFSANTTPVLEQEFVNDGTAAIYFLNFPVVHPIVSRDVALVGECVFQQGNDIFTQLEPVLMRGQQSLRSRADAIDMALAYAPDLDGGALRDCVASTEAADALAADVAAANQLRITGTPSVAVNGQLVANPTLANLRQAIRNAAN